MTQNANKTMELLNLISKMSIAQQKELIVLAKGILGENEVIAKSEPKKATKKPIVKTVGVLEQCKNHVRYVEGKWVAKKMMWAINAQMKSFGAKFDEQTKVWIFPDVESADKFMKAQNEYNKKRA